MDPTPTQQVQATRIPNTATIPTSGRAPATSTALSKSRFIAALSVAIISDIVSIWSEFIPPLQWVIDGVTALILFALLGRRWEILPALVAEAIPGVAAFPFWILVVLAVHMSQSKARRKTAPPPSAPSEP